jgi:hypothetical protein
MEFEFNEEGLAEALRDATRQWSDDHQPKMDALTEELTGQPVDEIKPVVDRAMRSWGGEISDDAELERIATAISQGERVILRPSA